MGASKWAREIVDQLLRAKYPDSPVPAPFRDFEAELAYALDDARRTGHVEGMREVRKLIRERVLELEPESTGSDEKARGEL